METQTNDVIVIGGGPAGMIAAITAASGTPMSPVDKKELSKVLIIEKYKLGGIASYGNLSITRNWSIPGGKLVTLLKQEIKQLNVNINLGEIVTGLYLKGKSKKIITNRNSYLTKIVIIACGIFPFPEYLSKENVVLLTDIPENQDNVFSSLKTKSLVKLTAKKIANKLNFSKPILLVGNSKYVLKTERKIRKLAPHQRIMTLSRVYQGINIEEEKYKKILFDYNSFKNSPPTSVFLNKTGLKTVCGYIKTNQYYQTNMKGVFACGNIAFPISGALQALYSGFVAGLKVREILYQKKFNREVALFPWVQLVK